MWTTRERPARQQSVQRSSCNRWVFQLCQSWCVVNAAAGQGLQLAHGADVKQLWHVSFLCVPGDCADMEQFWQHANWSLAGESAFQLRGRPLTHQQADCSRWVSVLMRAPSDLSAHPGRFLQSLPSISVGITTSARRINLSEQT